jgi:hypothetical protein
MGNLLAATAFLWVWRDCVATRYPPWVVGPAVALMFTLVSVGTWGVLPFHRGWRWLSLLVLGLISVGMAGLLCAAIFDPSYWPLGALYALARLLECPPLAGATLLWGVGWSEHCLPAKLSGQPGSPGLSPS